MTITTIEHLGQDATADDLADFEVAVERVSPYFARDYDSAVEWIWGNGDYTARLNADICIYCDGIVADRTIAPVRDDDGAWAELAGEHLADCEWLVTRAHRLAS